MSINSNISVPAVRYKRYLAALVKVLILAGVLWLVFVFAAKTLKKIAIAQIAELTNTKIEAELVNLDADGSIFIQGLVVRPDQKAGYDNTILKAKTVYARFGIGSLLLLRPRLKKISVNDFVFNAQYDLNTNRWNLATLKITAPKGGSGKIPAISLKAGVLKYCKVSNGRIKVAAEVPLDIEFGPAEKEEDGNCFKITTGAWKDFPKSNLTGFWKPGHITIAGGLTSTNTPAIEKAWNVNVLAAEIKYDRQSNYSLVLRVKDLQTKPAPTDRLFAFDKPAFLKSFGPFVTLQKFFDRYRPWGQVDIDFEASGNLDRLSESTLNGKVYCRDVSIRDRKFPYLIEHLAGEIDFTEKTVSLNNVRGKHNDVDVAFNGTVEGLGHDWKCWIQFTSDNMALDKDLYDAIKERHKKLWSAVSPTGLAAVDWQFKRQSKTDKKTTLAVELLDAQALYRRFPYPLKNLSGKLFFDPDTITISDLVSLSNEHKIVFNGKVTACRTDRPIYDLSIKTENTPLDSTLSKVLPDMVKDFCIQNEVVGLVDTEIKVFTPRDNTEPTAFIADVSFKNTSLKLNQSQLTITDISGKAVFTPDSIQVKKLTGHHGGGRVSLAGQIWLGTNNTPQSYNFSVHATETQLNNELLSILPAPIEKIISELQIAGKINYRVDLSKPDTQAPIDYKITVDCLGNRINFKHFPYPLKDITGQLAITKDSITLRDMTALTANNIQIAPNPATITVNGRIDLTDNTFGSAVFALKANDILFDEQLYIALPKEIQSFYEKFSPVGRFDLDFENIKIVNADNGKKQINFAGTTYLKSCNLNFEPAITELNAVIKTKGSYKTDQPLRDINADVTADSLRIEGKTLTDLKTYIYYDQDLQGWTTRDLIAECYNGKVAGKFELKNTSPENFEYLLRVGFDDIDLKEFFSDSNSADNGNGHTTGNMCGSLGLTGQVGDNQSRIGTCSLKITDMRVGRLSLLAKILQLKITGSEVFAFDKMFIDSYIKKDNIFFEHVDLSGSNMAFNGSGRMGLQDRNIDLTLRVRGHNRLATEEPSILQSLADAIGYGVVKMDITGSIYDPTVTTTALPGIKNTFGILGTKPYKRR